MFNINIFTSIFKKKRNNKKTDDQYDNALLQDYRWSSLAQYINIKYPSCPNSDYIKLMQSHENFEGGN